MEREELKESVARLVAHELGVAIMDQINEGIFIVDDRAKLLYANARAYELTGYSPGEMLGQNLIEKLVTQEQQAKVVFEFLKRLKGKPGVYNTAITTKQRKVRKVRISAAPVTNKAGETIASVGLIAEI